MNRRQFLGGVVAAGAFLAVPAWARIEPRTLVMIHLVGGNDGLNTVIPYRDPLYARLRPTIAVRAADALPLDSQLALHPALSPLKSLFDSKRLCVVPGVGYAKPSLSHFRSTEIWATASEQQASIGWLGRYVEQQAPNPFRAVSVGGAIPLALVGKHAIPLTVGSFERCQLPAAMNDAGALFDTQGSQTLEAVARQSRLALNTASKLARVHDPGGTDLPADLQRVVALMRSGLGIEIIHVALGGFDTHVRQTETHNKLLATLATALSRFQQDLEGNGLADRTLTVVFSEFGRRAEENSGAGTDHGTAGPMFLMGTGVQPGICGAMPSLTNLDEGNLRYTTDFRSVYAAILQDWLRTSPAPILGNVPPVSCLKA